MSTDKIYLSPADAGGGDDSTQNVGRRSRREFIRDVATAGAGLAAGQLASSAGAQPAGGGGAVNPPLSSLPGGPRPWMAAYPVYSGIVNLASANLQIAHIICGWDGKGGGLRFTLYHNSQSSRTGAFGPKWNHTYGWFITGTSPAVVVAGDGTETSFALANGVYSPPPGVYDALVKNGDGTWTLTRKGGTKINFSSTGLLTTIVDLNGNTVSCTYTGANLTTVTDAAGRNLTIGYSGSQPTSVTDAEARVWTVAFDASARVNKITDPLINSQSYNTQFGYDTSNNLTTKTNRLGKSWTYAISTGGVMTSTTDPDTRKWTLGYASPGGGGFSPIRDSIGPPWPNGTTAVGSVTDPTNSVTQYGFDATGHLLAALNGDSDMTVYTYDTANNRLTTTLPSQDAYTSTFDGRANKLTETNPLGKVTSYTYDTGDRVLTVTDANNHTTTFGYDAHGNQSSMQDPLGNTTSTLYTSYGMPAQITDPDNKVTSMGYDTNGNQNSVTDPLGHATTYVWQNTVMTQRTDAVGRITNYTHDAWGRLTNITYPVSAAVALTYDAEGNLTQSVDGTGTRTYTYDSWARKTGQTDPRGNTVATYDYAGRLLTQTDPTTRQLHYAYDGAGLLTQVGDSGGNANYTHDLDGRISTITMPNGTTVTYTYDSAGRVSAISHTLTSTGATIVSYAAVYDSGGRLTQVTESPSGDITAYGYDAAGRLTSENRTGVKQYTSTYTYDSRGNRLTGIRTENGITSHNGTYTYDDDSRLVQVIDSATGLTETYGWNNDNTMASYPGSGFTERLSYDEEQRLIQVNHDFGGGNNPIAYQYAYGYDGIRRWRKSVAQNTWTWYPCGVACSAGELVELQSDLNGITWSTAATYLKPAGCGAQIVHRNSEYSHYNLGGAAGVITDASGNVLSSNVYDMFGVARFTNGTAQTPWRWGDTEVDGLVLSGGGFALPGRGAMLRQHKHPKPLPPIGPPGHQPGPRRDCGSDRSICYLKWGTVATGCFLLATAAGVLGAAVCNADPEPFSKAWCFRQLFITVATMVAACSAAYLYNTHGCDVKYEACLAGGGKP